MGLENRFVVKVGNRIFLSRPEGLRDRNTQIPSKTKRTTLQPLNQQLPQHPKKQKLTKNRKLIDQRFDSS